MDNILSFIGLMKKAGALAIGTENAVLAAQKHKAKMLIVSADTSPHSASMLEKAADIPIIKLGYTKQELGAALGQKECASLALLDRGFADALSKKLTKN